MTLTLEFQAVWRKLVQLTDLIAGRLSSHSRKDSDCDLSFWRGVKLSSWKNNFRIVELGGLGVGHSQG